LADALKGVERQKMNPRLVPCVELERLARHRHAGHEPAGTVNRHDKPAREPEVPKEMHEFGDARLFVLVACSLIPLEWMKRAAGAANIGIEADISPLVVSRSQFRGTAGREHEFVETLSGSCVQIGKEQTLEAEPGDHAIQSLDDRLRIVDAIYPLDEFKGFPLKSLDLWCHQRPAMLISVCPS
jgi:hypothetical protein